jgi:hypothetical protein
MTRRDFRWRVLGAVLFIGGPSLALLTPGRAAGPHGLVTVLCLVATLLGLVLLIRGRKVALALRVENSPHRMLPALLHERRLKRRRPRG